MYQLLLDSSNIYLAVGLSKDGEVIDSIFYNAWQRQSELMVNEIENIFKRNNIDKKDLNAVVVGIGPGSYTGVRIGATIAKTIAYALKIKVYAKSSLSLLRCGEDPTICLFNARSGRSYFAVYQGKKVLEKECVIPNEEVLSYIQKHPDYKIAGDTAQIGKESEDLNIIANLADFDENELVKNIFTLNPIYLKDLLK